MYIRICTFSPTATAEIRQCLTAINKFKGILLIDIDVLQRNFVDSLFEGPLTAKEIGRDLAKLYKAHLESFVAKYGKAYRVHIFIGTFVVPKYQSLLPLSYVRNGVTHFVDLPPIDDTFIFDKVVFYDQRTDIAGNGAFFSACNGLEEWFQRIYYDDEQRNIKRLIKDREGTLEAHKAVLKRYLDVPRIDTLIENARGLFPRFQTFYKASELCEYANGAIAEFATFLDKGIK